MLQGPGTRYHQTADRTRGVPHTRFDCGANATRRAGSLMNASKLTTRTVVCAVKNLHDRSVVSSVHHVIASRHRFVVKVALQRLFTHCVFSANLSADSSPKPNIASDQIISADDRDDNHDTEESCQQYSLAWSLAPISVGVSTAVSELGANCIFMSAFWSWFIAQIAKLFTAAYREGKWDYRVMFDSGGMPSSHTALVVGLTTSIAYQYGFGSVYFPLSLAFTLIVMYDAAGVRRHAGKQAEVLNKIVEDLFHGSAISDKKLKEVLGHSPLQVTCGAILGAMVGTIYMIRYAI